jgi:hypothetical protein
MVVRMNRPLAAERSASELAASVCDDLVDVHVELRSATGHPDVERKHLMVHAGKEGRRLLLLFASGHRSL